MSENIYTGNGNGNGQGHGTEAELPELNATKEVIEKGLVFIELKETVRQKLDLPPLVPIFKTDLDQELAGGQIAISAMAAGAEALKLVQPHLAEYDRFLARYYLLEGERLMTLEPRDLYQAQRYFQKALDADQDVISAEGAFYLAALVGGDDQEEAVRLYRLSTELNPQAAAPHFELGRLLRERRDLPGALEEFEAAYRLEPTSARLLYEVGDTHLLANDYLKAQASYRRAVELEPEQWMLPIKLGISEYHLQTYPAAIRHLRSGLDLSPDELVEGFAQNLYIEGLYYLALAYRDSGRPDQARKLFRAVLQLNPQHAEALAALD